MVGCEQRIAEPRPEALGAPASSAEAAEQVKPARPEQQPPAEPRCIEETPETPERTARLGADPNCPPDRLSSPPTLRTTKLSFEAPDAPEITVEVAEQPAHRQRGLMYRTEMAADHGMIFVFAQRRHNRFWMRNTCISLDMLFLDDDGTIVGIEESTPTMTDQGFAVGCKSKYVLEVNGGFCRQHGVKAGQKVNLDRL